MKILWTEFAQQNLKSIYYYHKKAANKEIALKIKQQILHTTNQLKSHLLSGQVEESLTTLNENHRYLVSQNYKIIYKPVDKGILITDIFDTRLNPEKMKNLDLLR